MARRSDHTRAELHDMALGAARSIVTADGLAGLSTRRVAKAIGYSAGTLYQLFADLDDLIFHLNATTLDALFAACRGADLDASPESALTELARRYIRLRRRISPSVERGRRAQSARRSARLVHTPAASILCWAWSGMPSLHSVCQAKPTPNRSMPPCYGRASTASLRWRARISFPQVSHPQGLASSLVVNYVAGLAARER